MLARVDEYRSICVVTTRGYVNSIALKHNSFGPRHYLSSRSGIVLLQSVDFLSSSEPGALPQAVGFMPFGQGDDFLFLRMLRIHVMATDVLSCRYFCLSSRRKAMVIGFPRRHPAYRSQDRIKSGRDGRILVFSSGAFRPSLRDLWPTRGGSPANNLAGYFQLSLPG